MPVKLNGSTSGSVTVQAPAVAGTNTLTLPAATGNLLSDQSIVPGSSSVPTNGMYLPATNALGFATNSTNAMYIDSSQNVGVGTTSPNTRLQVYKAAASAFTGTSPGAFIVTDSTNTLNYYSNIDFNTTNTPAIPFARIGMSYTSSGSTLNFGTSNSYASGITNTAMTIDPTGNLLIGTTTLPIATTRVGIKGSTSAGIGIVSLVNTGSSTRIWTNGPDGNGNFLVLNDASLGMYMGYGATAWTANSDERLKTDLVPIENAASKVSLLRAVTGRFKTDEEGTSRSFLIAQDVQAVLPEAVDASDPDKLGVQYTDVIPLLVAAIKELSAKNDALEARLVALEAK